jgi:proline iminopeptidase
MAEAIRSIPCLPLLHKSQDDHPRNHKTLSRGLAMKYILRSFVTSLLVLTSLLSVRAQNKDVPTTEEFECIRLVSTTRSLPPGPSDRAITYHHVWVPVEGRGKELVVVVAGGPGMPREYFQPVLSPLGRFVRMAYYDRRADTRSTKPPFENVTVAEMAEDIDALRHTLGYNRITLLAHSFGGAIALEYALQYPSHVKRLILVGTSAVIEDQRNVEKRLAQTLPANQMASFTATEGRGRSTISCQQVQNRYRMFFPLYFHKPLEAKYSDLNAYSVYFDALARKLVNAGKESGFDVRSRLGEIKVPTLIIAGRHDLVTPVTNAEELARGIPYSRLAVFHHSGHFPFIEESYLFTEWIRQFIAGTTDLLDDLEAPQEIATPALDLNMSPTTTDSTPASKTSAPPPAGKNN